MAVQLTIAIRRHEPDPEAVGFGEAFRLSTVGPSQVDGVLVKEVWARLMAEPRSALIDVRTRAEWAFVGVPDLASIGKRTILVEWQGFPASGVNPAFADLLRSELEAIGADHDWDLYFICRSGARSLSAANTMAATGYRRCHNATEGFEGPLDPARHRGTLAGWKAEGLPWTQG